MENDCKKPAKLKCIYTIRGKCIVQSKLKKSRTTLWTLWTWRWSWLYFKCSVLKWDFIKNRSGIYVWIPDDIRDTYKQRNKKRVKRSRRCADFGNFVWPSWDYAWPCRSTVEWNALRWSNRSAIINTSAWRDKTNDLHRCRVDQRHIGQGNHVAISTAGDHECRWVMAPENERKAQQWNRIRKGRVFSYLSTPSSLLMEVQARSWSVIFAMKFIDSV